MKHRLWFTGKKLIRMALLLLGVSIVTFLLMSASPLDPLQTNVGQAALGSMSPEQIAKLEAYWGVDTPPLSRYLGWLLDAIRGDLGVSLLYRQPVLAVIGAVLAAGLALASALAHRALLPSGRSTPQLCHSPGSGCRAQPAGAAPE